MVWKETDILERDIILSIYKSPKSITEISKDIKRSKPTVSESVKRLLEQEILIKTHNYKNDARKSEISINKKRILIERLHMFYLKYYIFILSSLVFSFIISKITGDFFIIFGSVIAILPLLILMLCDIYTKQDKVIVYKNPKQ